MSASRTWVSVCVVVGLLVGTASAVNIDLVPVGNPGNAGEWSGASYGGYGPDRICGVVAYDYRIAKYEVSAGQYTEFLNKVAATDTYGVYSTSMWSSSTGCKIQRSGSSGSYTYNVASAWANRPVNYVSWYDTIRFANWMTSGNTESGSYTITNGGIDSGDVVVPDATQREQWAQGSRPYFLLPSEDEWYKAAYHKNDGVTGNYFDYPTSSDSVPSNQLIDPDPGNNATYYNNGYTIGSPYYRTEVGAHENSESPYGTFDQGGNVWEWNEAVIDSYRGVRGGSYSGVGANDFDLRASWRVYSTPSINNDLHGFRVVEVPEPGSAALLLLGALGLFGRRSSR